MPLPSSGAISLSQVNTELGRTATATISLGETAVRNLFGVASGAISMSNGYGKANAFAATITTSQQQLNLRTWALANGWNGSSAATITINSGVYIWSDNRTVAGLTIDGSWPGGVAIINNGFIIGKGGTGDAFIGNATRVPGTTGGPALSLGVNVTIANNNYIAGGGGGGASTSANGPGGGSGFGGGGGAGGGAGGQGYHSSVRGSGTATGGTGGAIGTAGTDGGTAFQCMGGGGGGRILPGTGGAGATTTVVARGGGAGGGGGMGPAILSGGQAAGYGSGGGGGGWGASGGRAAQNGVAGAGGSGNSAGGNSTGTLNLINGQAGGNAVALNGFSVTWTATGTRWGNIS